MPPHPCANPLWPYPIHRFVDATYVEETGAGEAAEAFCRTAPAYVETLETERLKDYFDDDNFGMGVVSRDFITSVTFVLDECFRAIQPRLHGESGTYTAYTKPLQRLTNERLSAIFGEEPMRLRKITFLTKSNPFRAIATLETSITMYTQLKALGAEINVAHYYSHTYSGRRLVKIDLHGIMDLHRREWEHHFMRECKRQDPQNFVWAKQMIETNEAYKEWGWATDYLRLGSHCK